MLCSDCCCSVRGGVGGAHLDTADAVTFDDSELDVALVTPGGVPGVLDEPVVLAVLGAVADGEDGVIELGAALGGVEDTGPVGLEDHLVGLDEDGKGLLGESGLHLGGVAGGNGTVRGDRDGGGGGSVVLASAASLGGAREVGVGGLELGLVGLEVAEGPERVATVAALVEGVGAVNELLLREGEELTGGLEVGTLERASGGERPAGAALALVLHGGDGTGIDPVDTVGDVRLVEDGHLSVLVGGDEAEHALVLLVGPVGELVVAGGPGVVALVDALDGEVSELEVLHAGLELVNGVHALAELSEVVHVLELVLVQSGDGREGEGEGERFHSNFCY
mmetsp:Transcript_228/g.341  ORF Transcript_228/g.341 Transcript_228/m.341 type:complete len:336 (+) Transcript_228:102-1109(+)